jgi:23S rRNA pseudouridine1911/1915/1917 synthase
MAETIEVIYEDNHILVVNKPGGLLTQPSGTDQESLEQRAKEWVKITRQKPGNVFLGAVHRLDKPVSGVVLLGCTSKALSRLSESIRNRKTQKTYLALVEGCPREKEGELRDYMIHDEYRAQLVDRGYPGAKSARLTYKVIERRGETSLLEIDLDTGRYHQIRLQLSSIGCPILGDVKYGSKTVLEGGDRIALHHFRFECPHPITKELIVFEAPIPKNIFS